MSTSLLAQPMDLEEQLKSPFPFHFGLDATGAPNSDLVAFHTSDTIYMVWIYHMLIGASPSRMTQFLTLLNLVTEIGLSSVCMYSYTQPDLANLGKLYPYVSKLSSLIQDHPYKGLNYRLAAEIDPDHPPGGPTSDFGLIVTDLIRQAQIRTKILQRCVSVGVSKIRIFVDQLIIGTPQTYKIRQRPGENFTGHSNQIIIDLETQTGYIIDSASGTTKFHNNTESILVTSLEVYLQEYLGLQIKISDSCATVNLQGRSDLCSVWTSFLFLLLIVNPDLSWDQMCTILAAHTQTERDRYLFQYMYYVATRIKSMTFDFITLERIAALKTENRLPPLI